MQRTIPLLLLALLLACTRTTTTPAPTTSETPSQRLDRAIEFGCYRIGEYEVPVRSDVYATFKDGTALTPLAATAWQDDGQLYSNRWRNAVIWLTKKVKPDGTIDEGPDGLPYPLYTAALTLTAIFHKDFELDEPDVRATRDAWLKYLLARQLTEQNGWAPGEKQYGGWGYYPQLPKKPKHGEIVPAQQLLESNLSATVFALEALKAAGVTDPKILEPAKRFVLSCQNEDGGFHFIYDDPVRNKAGTAKPGIFNSYGSATADGVRALLLCGMKRDDPRVVAGRAWLVKHFAADIHPGEYIPTHERNRNAVYFYYTRSVAKTLRMLGEKDVKGRHWAESLSAALLAKQKADGSWANEADQQRENDPILATAYAVSALAECRNALAAK